MADSGYRSLLPFIAKDLSQKMVFLGGPRQVGKTTLALATADSLTHHSAYYNWDSSDDQQKIISEKFSPDDDLLIFDEIHKYKNWKNYIKGLYDTKKEQYKMLVTGSARLDLYRKGGDFLMGRYHYYRLHPFSVAEALGKKWDEETALSLLFSQTPTLPINFSGDLQESQQALKILYQFGGFPEPFFERDMVNANRWKKERKTRLLREDIRDTSNIHDLSKLQILMSMIPDRVGSLLSLESLRQDLSGAHQTVAKWIEIFENFYYLYRIYPFRGSLSKSLKKEPKVFLWDWSEVENEGARFENMIGSHLLKYVHFLEDVYGQDAKLEYWRDKDGREVDFIVSLGKNPIWAIEVKLTDEKPSKNLKYLKERVSIEKCFQVISTPGVDFEEDGIRVMSANKFLLGLV